MPSNPGEQMTTFEQWMKSKKLSKSTILKYAGAINGVLSEWAVTAGIITNSISSISDSSQFELVADSISKLPVFLDRNATGHTMYSNALKKYGEFLQDINAELSSFSWTINNKNTATKVLDKSAFLHRGTAIPVEIRPFFIEVDLKSGQKLQLNLLVGEESFDAHIEMDTQESPRARLFWNSDFSKKLQKLFPYHYQMFKDDLKDSVSELFMRFDRVDGFNSYIVSFTGELKQVTLQQDFQSEEVEDKGFSKDGAVKEYYGKRYERDPANRKKAIKIHGITCKVCNFNFEEFYGERGTDFIEVHHRKPIHTFEGEAQTINPLTDLIPVCSNCHRMIHRRSDSVLTVEELKEIYLSVWKTKEN